MGLFHSLCKKCDDELDWFLEAKKGIKCRDCGTHNTQEDLWENFCGLDYHKDKETFLRKRRTIKERKLKIDKIKKSL
jgi:anaerobic ribonucleoside-triphosphate reductase